MNTINKIRTLDFRKAFFLCLMFSIFSFLSISLSAQLNIQTSIPPEQLVLDYFQGSGVSISNITFKGAKKSIGKFSTGNNPINLGFSEGIILSSGKVSDASGPNNSTHTSTMFGNSGDPLLTKLVPGFSTNDASVLEFDFIPKSDTIRFRYIFGSEEYPEFVNSFYNDVFGFFITGSNPNGANYKNKNIALIPGSSQAVSIDNVNVSNNNQYYVGNGGGAHIEYDAFTRTFTAWCVVIPCQVYHIKIAIADAGDDALDSFVMLESKSFMTNSLKVKTSYTSSIANNAIEGCNNAIVSFHLDNKKSVPTTVKFFIEGTADNGIDYTLIPDSVIIPAGSDSASILIEALYDNIPENNEYIKLRVNDSPCSYYKTIIRIFDNSDLLTESQNDSNICGTNIGVIADGGFPPYSYDWNSGQTSSLITAHSLDGSASFIVRTTDACGASKIDSFDIKTSKPVAKVINDAICLGDTAEISVFSNSPISQIWETGEINSNIIVSPISSYYYSVIVTDTAGCKDTAHAYVQVNHPPTIGFPQDTTICDPSQLYLQPSDPGINYQWNTGDTTSFIIVSTSADLRKYILTLTDSNNCKASDTINLQINPRPELMFRVEADSICKGSSADLIVFGADYFIWNNGSTATSITVRPKSSTNYIVTAFNELNNVICSKTDTFHLKVSNCGMFELFFPTAFSPNSDGHNESFKPEGIFETITNFEMVIYDRWSNKIFVTNDIFQGWDGTYKNKNLKSDVFMFVAKVQQGFDEEKTYTGCFLLVK